jgi:hypothetical protein
MKRDVMAVAQGLKNRTLCPSLGNSTQSACAPILSATCRLRATPATGSNCPASTRVGTVVPTGTTGGGPRERPRASPEKGLARGVLNGQARRNRIRRINGVEYKSSDRRWMPRGTVKLVMAAAKTWRKLKGENQLPKVVQRVTFRDGVEVINTPAQNAA